MIFSRRVLIDGFDNIRDLGGFQTSDGHITKMGVFFRSESLFHISEKHLTELKNHNIFNCIDIHGPIDNSGIVHPFEADKECKYYCIPVLSDLINHTGTEKDNFQVEYWIQVNTRMLENNKDWICSVMKRCADTTNGTVIHCRTGKSRTSLISMLIMSIANIPQVDIPAEFSTTDVYMERKYAELLKTSNHAKGFYQSPAFIMDKTVEYLITNYGDVNNYLTKCGLEKNDIEKIHHKFVI